MLNLNNEVRRQEFSARLHKALDDAGVRVHGRATDVAREITARVDRITPNATGSWLKGGSIPNVLHLRALAEWLNVRLEWLQYGTKPMRGAAHIDKASSVGPKTLQLSARIADLERRGNLSKPLVRALNAMIDAAVS